MPRPTRIKYAKRPITDRSADPEEAKRALRVVAASVRTMLGEDDDPSPLWDELIRLPGTDPDGWELAQDCGLMCPDICDIVAENLEDPKRLASELMFYLIGAVPEIKADIEALQDD